MFGTVLTSEKERLLENIYGIGEALTILEEGGYDEHPEVGPLIKETRSLQLEASYCIDDLLMRYGN